MIQFMACMILTATTQTAPNDALAPARLEKMLAVGDREMIIQVFKRNDDHVLVFIDRYLEGGLKMIEDGKSEEEAMQSFRKAIAFAKIADEALPGATFVEYAAGFASWSPQERVQFRRGQAEYRAGRKAMDDPEKAAEHFRASLKIAESLRDTWGMAMALGGLVQSELAMGRHAKVEEAARQAVQVCAQLRLRLDQVRALIAWGDAQANESARGHGAPSYQYAFSIMRPTDDADLRRTVITRQCRALERSGAKDAADMLRQQHAELLGIDDSPPPRP
jgi:hypothetical protein